MVFQVVEVQLRKRAALRPFRPVQLGERTGCLLLLLLYTLTHSTILFLTRGKDMSGSSASLLLLLYLFILVDLKLEWIE